MDHHDRSTFHVMVREREGETEGISRHGVRIHVINGKKDGCDHEV